MFIISCCLPSSTSSFQLLVYFIDFFIYFYSICSILSTHIIIHINNIYIPANFRSDNLVPWPDQSRSQAKPTSFPDQILNSFPDRPTSFLNLVPRSDQPRSTVRATSFPGQNNLVPCRPTSFVRLITEAGGLLVTSVRLRSHRGPLKLLAFHPHCEPPNRRPGVPASAVVISGPSSISGGRTDCAGAR